MRRLADIAWATAPFVMILVFAAVMYTLRPRDGVRECPYTMPVTANPFADGMR